MKRLGKKAKTLIWVLACLLVVIGLTFALSRKDDRHVTELKTTVTVTNGKADPETLMIPITVEKDGTYRFVANWAMGEETPGFVTGLVVSDDAGEELFFVTGVGLDAASEDVSLTAGTYSAQIRFLATEEAYLSYVAEHAVEIRNDPMEWADSESFDLNIIVGYEKGSNVYYLLGLFCGAFVGLLIAATFLLLSKTNDNTKCEYDERQIAARGIAFKYGFFAMLFANVAVMILELAGFSIPVQTGMLTFLALLLGVCVFLTNAILHDAYFSMNENRRWLLILFGIIAVVNLLGGWRQYSTGNMIVNGVLTSSAMNLFVGIMFVYILIITAIKAGFDRKEDEE